MRDVTHIPGHILYLGFLLWHLWMTRPLRTCVNTCAHVCTKLTHALNRKFLSLTKRKGKIYKTKSLSYHITILLLLFHQGWNAIKQRNRDYTIPKSISLKENVIALLEFEPINYGVAGLHVSPNATGPSPGTSAFSKVWFGLISLFNGISTFFRLFNAKAILLEEQ